MCYKFLKKEDNSYIAVQIEPNWIYMQENGYYGLCDYERCEGVAINGVPYHLEGREGLSDLETVYFEEIDEHEYNEIITAEKQELLDIVGGMIEI